MKKPCSNKNKLHKKLGNAGMSLVEVIIAITILGLVVVPVCQSLTTAMIYNAKARTRQEMTLTAESIMEIFKSYDIASLKEIFQTNGYRTLGVELTGQAGYETGCSYSSAADDSSLTFMIKGMEAENDKVYNVTITVDNPTTQKVFEIADMNSERDAVFYADRSDDTSALQNARNDLSNYKTELEDYFKNYCTNSEGKDAMYMDEEGGDTIVGNIDQIFASDAYDGPITNYVQLYDRTLLFEIIEESDGVYAVTASMQYRYYVKDYPYYEPRVPDPVPDGYYTEGQTEPESTETDIPGNVCYLTHYPVDADGNPDYLTYTVDLDSSSDTETKSTIYRTSEAAQLNRLFVFYYPQYELADAGHDNIEIVNTVTNSDTERVKNLACYIIKQVAPDMSGNKVAVKENSYRGSVKVTDPTRSTVIYHNFATNIGNGSTTTASYTISGDYAKESSFTNTENGSPFLYDEKLAYHVKLVITDADTGSTVTELESTMNEKISQEFRQETSESQETGESHETETQSAE